MNCQLSLVSILLIINGYNISAQSDFREGFIITLENDTINVQVDYRSNSKNYESCLFKNGQGEVEYFPNQIAGFGYINDKFFSSQIVEDSFVEVLVLGEISLYKSNKNYLLQKGDDVFELEYKMIEVEKDGKKAIREDNKWRGITSFLMSDCLTNNVSNLKFKEQSLTMLAIRYNKCKKADFIVYKVNKPWTQIDLGVTIGLTSSNIKVTDELGLFSYLDNSYSSIDPTIGFLIAISSPRITERFAFQSELHFSKSNYSALVEINGSSTEYHDTFIDLSTLSVPLSLKYSFPEKKYGFYIQGGINYDYHLDSEAKLLSERVTGSVVSTFPESSAFEIHSGQIGYWGGIGILKSYSRFKGSIAIRYFQMFALNKTLGFTANNSRVSINLILFKK